MKGLEEMEIRYESVQGPRPCGLLVDGLTPCVCRSIDTRAALKSYMFVAISIFVVGREYVQQCGRRISCSEMSHVDWYSPASHTC